MSIFWSVIIGSFVSWLLLLFAYKKVIHPRRIRRLQMQIEQATTSEEAFALWSPAAALSDDLGKYVLKKRAQFLEAEQDAEFEKDFKDALGYEEKLTALLARITKIDFWGYSGYPTKYETRVLQELYPFTEERIAKAKSVNELLVIKNQKRICPGSDIEVVYHQKLLALALEEAIKASSSDAECFTLVTSNREVNLLMTMKKNILETVTVSPHSRLHIIDEINSALREEIIFI